MTRVISAFPGTGKTWLHQNGEGVIWDSDSSKFPKEDFPANYIEHIKSGLGVADIIMVSSHKAVREALVENGIEFTLVYPPSQCLDEYIERYQQRQSPATFIDLLARMWSTWMREMDEQKGCHKILLRSGEFLADVIHPITTGDTKND